MLALLKLAIAAEHFAPVRENQNKGHLSGTKEG